MYIYVCLYIYVYVYVYTSTYIYIYIYWVNPSLTPSGISSQPNSAPPPPTSYSAGAPEIGSRLNSGSEVGSRSGASEIGSRAAALAEAHAHAAVAVSQLSKNGGAHVHYEYTSNYRINPFRFFSLLLLFGLAQYHHYASSFLGLTRCNADMRTPPSQSRTSARTRVRIAIFDPLPTPRFHAIHHTILCIAIFV